MAIDKIRPNKLQADLDQRLVNPEAGEMIDAQNVMFDEDGANTAGVIKNVYGTTAITRPALSAIADSDSVTVIGSVSDSQRGYIYWFVADDSGSTQHAIYRQNTSTESYELVLKNSGLNFDPGGFVKGDVLSSAFQQDGVVQTILYFTDNNNPPRKINVDRALSSTVYDATGDDFDTVISACKPAMNGYPSFSFSTDTDFPENNFRDVFYQFATQLIYIDGEESAISGYSELAITRPEIFSTMEETGFGVSPYLDNVCEITIPVDLQVADLEKVRIIARDGNSGTFFVVDEFDPDQDLYRQTYGVSKQIYNASSRTYRFYNNALGRGVSSNVVNKTYDNVPFVAAGQAIAGNRLMYSNYSEGRPNVVTDASFTVNYLDDDGSGSGELIKAGASLITEETSGFEIDLEVNSPSAFDINTSLEVGTIMEFGFDFGLDFKIEGSQSGGSYDPNDRAIRFSISDSSGSATYANKAPTDIRFDRKINQQTSRVSAVKIIGSTTSVGSAFTQLAALFNDVTVRYEVYTSNINGINLLELQKEGGDQATRYLRTTGSNQYMEVTWGFDGYTTGSGTIAIRPYVKKINPSTSVITDSEGTLVSGESIVAGSDNSILRSGIYTGLSGHGLQGALTYYAVTGNNNPDITGYLFGKTGSIRTSAFEKTFKAGSSHTFGIVYYDKFNRSGNVNLLGSTYVEPIQSAARASTQRGACSITVDLSNTTPPDWATSYQIVYAGADSFSDYVQYTTSGGYFKHEHGTTGSSKNPDVHIKEVYLSLNTLDVYNQEKNTSRQYSFTEGDKLRVISSYGSTREYELSDDSKVMEFDVVGVETASDAIMGYGVSNAYGDIPVDEVNSTVLKLVAPQVNAGIDRYQDFDWFDVSGTDPSALTSSAANVDNKWGQGTVVEIVTPRKYTKEKVFYEIGHGGTISSGSHGTNPVLTNGDTYFRPVSCKTAPSTTVGDLAAMDYRTFYLESNTVSDGFSSKHWHQGRPHVVFEDSATVRRYNGITYSDAYAEDVANLSLSSFNPSLANFYSLESYNGACNYIGGFRDGYLVALQENKMSLIPINKDIISSASGAEIVSLSTNVLGEPRYYAGDYGVGDNPESVVIQDSQVFFVDVSKSKVLRWSSEGLSPISDKGVSSIIETNVTAFLAQNGTRVPAGYDPRFDQYLVTFRPTGTYAGLTIGYSVPIGGWQSRYTFYPNTYANQNDMLYSSMYNDPQGDNNADIFWSHDSNSRSNFHGVGNQSSSVTVVSNYNPSMTKVYNSMSIEGDYLSNTVGFFLSNIITDLNHTATSSSITTGPTKEGDRYFLIGRDTSAQSDRNIIPLGVVATAPNSTSLTFTNKVNLLSVPLGAILKLMASDGTLSNIGVGTNDVNFNAFSGSRSISTQGPVIDLSIGALIGGEIVAVTEAAQNGDVVRGKWAEIKVTCQQDEPTELYCVNAHFSESKPNHSLGQQ